MKTTRLTNGRGRKINRSSRVFWSSGEALNWSWGTVIAASQSVSFESCTIILERSPPMLWPTRTIRSRALSSWLGSNVALACTRDSRNRAAEVGIGMPVG